MQLCAYFPVCAMVGQVRDRQTLKRTWNMHQKVVEALYANVLHKILEISERL